MQEIQKSELGEFIFLSVFGGLVFRKK